MGGIFQFYLKRFVCCLQLHEDVKTRRVSRQILSVGGGIFQNFFWLREALSQ